MSIRTESVACAEKVPTGFALTAVLTIVELIYYGYQAWSACHQAARPSAALTDLPDLAKSALALSSTRRRAAHRLRQVNRRHQAGYTPDQLDQLTTIMLNHADTLSTSSLVCCFQEPVTESQYEDETD